MVLALVVEILDPGDQGANTGTVFLPSAGGQVDAKHQQYVGTVIMMEAHLKICGTERKAVYWFVSFFRSI